MSRWTTTAQEYEHARKIVLSSVDYVGGLTKILLTDGSILEGHIVGSNSGTNIGENLKAGRGPAVTAMYGEIKVRLSTNQVVVIDVQDIERFG